MNSAVKINSSDVSIACAKGGIGAEGKGRGNGHASKAASLVYIPSEEDRLTALLSGTIRVGKRATRCPVVLRMVEVLRFPWMSVWYVRASSVMNSV